MSNRLKVATSVGFIAMLSSLTFQTQAQFDHLFWIDRGVHNKSLFPEKLYAIQIECYKHSNTGTNVEKNLGLSREIRTGAHVFLISQTPAQEWKEDDQLPSSAIIGIRPYSVKRTENYWQFDYDDDCVDSSRDKPAKKNTRIFRATGDLYIANAVTFSKKTELTPFGEMLKRMPSHVTSVLSPSAPEVASDSGSTDASGATTDVAGKSVTAISGSTDGSGASADVAGIAAPTILTAVNKAVGGTFSAILVGISRIAMAEYEAWLAAQEESTSLRSRVTLEDGTFSIFSPYTRLVVNVRPIDSFTRNPEYAFTSFFMQEWEKVRKQFSQNWDVDCIEVNNILKREYPFDSPLDRGFLLLQIVAPLNYTRQQIMNCLPSGEGFEVSEFGDRGDHEYIWGRADATTQRFTSDMFRGWKKKHPDNALIPSRQIFSAREEAILERLVSALNPLMAENTVSEPLLDDIRMTTNETLSLIDRSREQIIGSFYNMAPEAFVEKLRERGITHVGCPTKTDNIEQFSRIADGARAAFLGFKRGDQSLTKEDAVILRPFFNGNVERIEVIKDPYLTASILESVKPQYTCIGFTVEPEKTERAVDL